MLDKNFIAMINFLSLASIGKCGEIADDIDISAVLKYASEQAVIPLVTAGIQKHGKYSSEPIMQQMQLIALQMAAKGIQGSFVIKDIFEIYKKEKIDYAVLKGESLATLYNEPDLRISGDVDLLVAPRDEKRALKVLEGFGYYYDKKLSWSNETIARHEKNRMIEIHTSLFDETRNDIFFNNIASTPIDFMKMTTHNYGEISVLSPDDGIMFVYLHFVKHFLSSGAGSRQLMDVIVYSRHYLNEIDWDKFFESLKLIKYYQLYTYIISIAVEFMGIPENELPKVEIDKSKAEIVLEDTRSGGYLGKNDRDLLAFKRAYEKKRFSTFMSGDYTSYEKRYNKSKIRMIFPEYYYMRNRYPYISKFPPLIVVAWVERLIKAALKLLNKKRKISDYSTIVPAEENTSVNDRMKLMEDLGLI